MSTLQLAFHFLLLSLLLDHQQLLDAQPFYNSSANLSTTWINSHFPSTFYRDGTMIKPILLRPNPSSYGPAFGFGFYCADPCDHHLLSIFILFAKENSFMIFPDSIPQVVWAANRDSPVGWNATLEFTKDGELVLTDADVRLAWTTNTTGMDVAGLNLTENGNLVLLNRRGAVVWQSFEHPSDTLLSGQSLVSGQKLTANLSATNWTRGQPYITYTPNIGFQAFVGSNRPEKYYSFSIQTMPISSKINQSSSLSITKKALTFISNSSSSSKNLNAMLGSPTASTVQFLRLEFDGRLKLYEWMNVTTQSKVPTSTMGWYPTADIIELDGVENAFPMVCGEYGICQGGNCACPQDSNELDVYFKHVDHEQPALGCVAITPLSCKSRKRQGFVEVRDVSYFSYIDDTLLHSKSTTEESCKGECLNNCICEAALFKYGANDSQGSCYLLQEVFSLMSIEPQMSSINSTAYIKVQFTSNRLSTLEIVGIAIGVSLVGLVLVARVIIVLYRRGIAREEKQDDDEDNLRQLPGTSVRFSYDDLKQATQNFARQLGSGGFGTVFEGTLANGMRVAVKKLDSVRQGKREFLTEVETIGSIHHFSLVRLVGYCAESSHRLLVYEYMSNGSLDNWIFQKTKMNQLTWETRCKIIYDVAKGLLYLHEDCQQKIVHLDIKPQNILLDSNFKAKVSDFGLAKLIDRDQSAVVTMMRGTPGYLAPEWLTSIITEKADVYSFGIVIVEIVCGKKNLDDTRPFERMLLLPILKEKAVKGQLLDLVDDRIRDWNCKAKEIEKMLRLALWCSQNEPSKRPSMSMVVKVLEGVMDVNDEIDYDSIDRVGSLEQRLEFSGSTSSAALLESDQLSGPR